MTGFRAVRPADFAGVIPQCEPDHATGACAYTREELLQKDTVLSNSEKKPRMRRAPIWHTPYPQANRKLNKKMGTAPDHPLLKLRRL